MYENFFGFKERPFQLVPNPAYLFLSRGHEEALAHLTYAVSRGDGFVEISGEVGTGKTTLCRAFLDNLDKNTEVAYIFNPKLNAKQLLKAINDELGIDSKPNSVKVLIDKLNFFLMEKKAEGKKVILVIDEAQNLSKEVLEQLRLLSNLETTTNKLLQIILVGQPELREMLDSYELRQLGQRITLSYHLIPLNFKETKEYIDHRIRIASRKPGLRFSWSALRTIYKYSQGVPRLINIACDRAILTAYSLNQYKITGNIARASIRELAGRGDIKHYGRRKSKKPMLILSALCIILLVLILYPPVRFEVSMIKTAESPGPAASQPQSLKKEIATPGLAVPTPAPDENLPEDQDTDEPEPDEIQENSEPDPLLAEEPETGEPETGEPEPETVHNLADFLGSMDTRSSRDMAMRTALELWNTEALIKEELDNMDDTEAFFRLGTKQNGLLVHRSEGGFELVKKLNLPAIFEFHSPAGFSPGYLTLIKTDERKMTFRNGDELIEAEPDEVEFYWPGVAYIPWKNFFSYTGAIPRNTSEDAVITLKMILRDIGFKDIEISPDYDDPTREAVEAIQEKHGLLVDGVVGPLTKIILYNEMKSLEIPHIGQ